MNNSEGSYHRCLAEDCVQDTFIKLAVKKPGFHGNSSFKTWLYAIGK